jgi:hypothetical protein
VPNVEDDDVSLYDCTWRAYKASPLFQIRLDALHAYQDALLNRLLVSSTRQTQLVDLHALKAVTTIPPGMDMLVTRTHIRTVEWDLWQDCDVKPIVLTIHHLSKRSQAPQRSDVVLLPPMDAILGDSIPFPLVLTGGTTSVCAGVLQWLRDTFHAHILPTEWPHSELRVITESYCVQALHEADPPQGQLTLVYRTPKAIQHLNNIHFTLDVRQLHSLFQTKCRVVDGVASPEFLGVLEPQLEAAACVRLSAMLLCKLQTPVVTLTAGGKVNFHWSEDTAPAWQIVQQLLVFST